MIFLKMLDLYYNKYPQIYSFYSNSCSKMLKTPELIKFNEEGRIEEEEWFMYVITNTEKYVDMSIFSIDEWERLEEMNKKFRMEQNFLNDLSDDIYSCMFNKDNPNYKKNIELRNSNYYLDRGLQKKFGLKFRDLEPIEECKINLKTKYEEIQELELTTMNGNKKECSKDTLRKWFIDNYQTLEEYLEVSAIETISTKNL